MPRKLASWYCLQTNFREEQRAEQHLVQQGYRVFLPLFLRSTPLGKQRLVPLFPGYIFASWFGTQSWHPVMSTQGVRGLLQTSQSPGLPIALPLGEIEQLAKAVDANSVIEPGRWVEVTQGEMRGFAGLTLLSDQERLIVLFNFARRRMSKSFDRDQVKLLATA